MTEIWRFPEKGKKQRGVIPLFVLHSLKKEPKSGYELIAEIKELTEGTWIPSKGTIYPLLNKLEDEGLIKIKKTDKRSKNIFGITAKGRKALLIIKMNRKEWSNKFFQFRKLIGDIITEENVNIASLFFEIRLASFAVSTEKKDEVIKILERCLSDLKKIESSKKKKLKKAGKK